MKRQIMLSLLAIAIFLIGTSTASADIDVSMWGGNFFMSGFGFISTVDTDSDTIPDSIKIVLKPIDGWKITESHVEVVIDPADIPTNKKGNPQPGHFSYAYTSPPTPVGHTYLIPFSDIGAGVGLGTRVFIALHSVIVLMDGDTIIQDETGWGGPCDLRWQPGLGLGWPWTDPVTGTTFWKIGTNRWGFFFDYIIGD